MVKFKNRVALNKISRFFKTTPLVIFFHCSDRNYLKKKLNESFVLGKSSLTKKKDQTENCVLKEDLMIRLLKNNHVKKALLNEIARNYDSCNNSLVQGNNLCLGLKKISFLNFIKDVIKDENINVLGGIYNNYIIDHNQVKRLITITEDKQIYENLNNKLKFNYFTLINQLTTPLSLGCTFSPHYKLIALLKSEAYARATTKR